MNPLSFFKSSKKIKVPSKNLWSSKKRHINTVFDIREKSLIIAVSELSRGIPTLTYLEEITYPENIEREGEGFYAWLKDVCKNINKKFPKSFFWILISSQYVKTYYFPVPKSDKKKQDRIIYLSLKKLSNVDIDKSIYDYTIIGEKKIEGVDKLEVFAYVVQKEYVYKAEKLAKRLGLNTFGITSYHLSISNLVAREKASSAHIFLGSDWSRIDIYRESFLVFSRDIKTGFVSFVNELMEKIGKKDEIELPLDEPTQEGENERENKTRELTPEIIKDYFIHLSSGIEYTGAFGGQLSKIDIADAVSSSLQRLILQIRRSLEFYTSSMQNEEVTKIYFSGVVPIPKFILEELEANIGVEVKLLAPITEKLILTTPNIRVHQVKEPNYAPIIGCSIQQRTNFNFLLTTKDIKKIERQKRISTAVSSFFVLISFILFGYYLHLYHKLNGEQAIYNNYKKQIEHINPLIDENRLQTIIKKFDQKKMEVKNFTKFYRPISIIKDFARITPSDIKWTGIEFKSGSKIAKLDVAVENSDMAKLKIGNYILILKSSPFIQEVNVSNERQISMLNKIYKLFTLHIKFK